MKKDYGNYENCSKNADADIHLTLRSVERIDWARIWCFFRCAERTDTRVSIAVRHPDRNLYVRQRTDGVSDISYGAAVDHPHLIGDPMCDGYIYYFVMSNSQDGEDMFSTRPATLETIKDRGGDPVMESQMVVDHTELDGDGFRVAAVGCDSHEINDIAAQIWSLKVRAASRDNEAISSTDEIEKYMLSLESRELRKQARVLKTRRTEIVVGELGFITDAKDFIHFAAGLAT